MARPTAIRRYVFRPLIGFGWVGVLGLVVLALIGYGLLTDYDFHHLANRVVLRLFGVDAMFEFVGRILPAHSLYTTGPVFGVIGTMILAIALFISPRPLRVWQWVLMAAWGVLEAVLISHVTGWLLPRPFTALTDFARPMVLAHGLCELASIALVWLTTRSRIVTLVMVAVVAGGTLDEYMRSATLYSPGSWIVPEWVHVYGYHTLLLVTLMSWATIARRNAPRPGQCQVCGYDMTRAALSVCPECGTLAAKT